MKTLFAGLLVFSSFMYGCASGPTIAEYVSPYPGDSMTNKAPLLEKQAVEGLRQMLLDQLKCNQFQITDREIIEVTDKFIVDSYGKLYSGGSLELWKVKACGQELKLDFAVINDGSRGANKMRFLEHKEKAKQ
ncbi:MAG: hypothetical protein ABL877_01700 [Thiobacillus sp.]